MERQPYRRPQQPYRGQPPRPAQRPPQRRPVQPGRPSRPGSYRRRRRRSKKPIILGAIALLLLIIIIGSIGGNDDSADQVKQNVNAIPQVETVVETGVEAKSDNFPQVAYDANGVRITLTGYKRDELVGDEIVYLFENNSSDPIMFGVGYAYVDGWQIATLGGNTLPAGTKANGTIYISKANLDESGISEVTNLTLKECNLWNDETYTLIDSFDITLNLG